MLLSLGIAGLMMLGLTLGTDSPRDDDSEDYLPEDSGQGNTDDGPDSLEICVAGILNYREPVTKLTFVGAKRIPPWK